MCRYVARQLEITNLDMEGAEAIDRLFINQFLNTSSDQLVVCAVPLSCTKYIYRFNLHLPSVGNIVKCQF
jgi:hypothetical protein